MSYRIQTRTLRRPTEKTPQGLLQSDAGSGEWRSCPPPQAWHWVSSNSNLLLGKDKRVERIFSGTGIEGLPESRAGTARQNLQHPRTHSKTNSNGRNRGICAVCAAFKVTMMIRNPTELTYCLDWLNFPHKLPDIRKGTHISGHKIVFTSQSLLILNQKLWDV